MDIISLIVFVVLIVLAFWRKVNMGVLAFAAALILGRILGMTDKDIVKTLSSSLFVTLTGITLLFAAVNSTGAFEMLSHKIVAVTGKRVWVLPIIAYMVGFILSAIGPGAIPPTTLVVTLTVSIAISAGYNPIMMGIIGGLGLMGGRVCAWTPEGALVSTLAAEQGQETGVILPVFAFQVITTVLFAIGLFFAFKGYKVKADNVNFSTEKVKANRNQIIALLSVVVMLVMVMVFEFDVGLVSFLIAVVLFLFGLADDSASIKAVPWGTIVMILGVGVLMSVISEAGGIDLLCNLLSNVMSKSTVAPFTGITAGIMSLVSSGFGVVYPTLLPMSTELVNSVGGGEPVAVMAAIIAGGSLAGFSPMSTCGALTLSTMVGLRGNMSKQEQNKAFVSLIIIAACAIIWVGISAFLFSGLCVSIFG